MNFYSNSFVLSRKRYIYCLRTVLVRSLLSVWLDSRRAKPIRVIEFKILDRLIQTTKFTCRITNSCISTIFSETKHILKSDANLCTRRLPLNILYPHMNTKYYKRTMKKLNTNKTMTQSNAPPHFQSYPSFVKGIKSSRQRDLSTWTFYIKKRIQHGNVFRNISPKLDIIIISRWCNLIVFTTRTYLGQHVIT